MHDAPTPRRGPPSSTLTLTLTLDAWGAPRVGVERSWRPGDALRATARHASRRLEGAAALVARGFPVAAVVYWSLVVPVDFLNDWLVVSLTGPYRPVGGALVDMAVWWIPWVLATPALVWSARRLSPRRLGWRGALAAQLPVMLVAIAGHALVAAALFAAITGGPGQVLANFEAFARSFTLSESLLYWGLVGALYLGDAPAAGPASRPAASGREARGGPADAAGEALPPIQRFAVRDGDVVHFVAVADVDYIEAAGNYVRLHVGDRDHLVRATLAGVQERLDARHFRRIHRSTIVNLERVAQVATWFNGDYVVMLADGRRLRVSRTYRESLLEPLS